MRRHALVDLGMADAVGHTAPLVPVGRAIPFIA